MESLKRPIGLVRNLPFEARGLTDPWQHSSEFYIFLRAGETYIQAPRVTNVEWSEDRKRWEIRCEDMCALGTSVFNGALIYDAYGHTIAIKDFRNPVCVCNGDTLRIMVSLEYPEYQMLEYVVDHLQKQHKEKFKYDMTIPVFIKQGIVIKHDKQVMVK